MRRVGLLILFGIGFLGGQLPVKVQAQFQNRSFEIVEIENGILKPRTPIQVSLFGGLKLYEQALSGNGLAGCESKKCESRDLRLVEGLLKRMSATLQHATAEDRAYYLSETTRLLLKKNFEKQGKFKPSFYESGAALISKVIIALARHNRIQFLMPEERRGLGGVYTKKTAGSKSLVIGSYNCSQTVVSIDLTLSPYDVAGVTLHELNHLLIDKSDFNHPQDLNGAIQSLVLEESLSSLTSAIAQMDLIATRAANQSQSGVQPIQYEWYGKSTVPLYQIYESLNQPTSRGAMQNPLDLNMFNKSPESSSRLIYSTLSDSDSTSSAELIHEAVRLNRQPFQNILNSIQRFYFRNRVQVSAGDYSKDQFVNMMPLLETVETYQLAQSSLPTIERFLGLGGSQATRSQRCLLFQQYGQDLKKSGYLGASRTPKKPLGAPGIESVKTSGSVVGPGIESVKTEIQMTLPCRRGSEQL